MSQTGNMVFINALTEICFDYTDVYFKTLLEMSSSTSALLVLIVPVRTHFHRVSEPLIFTSAHHLAVTVDKSWLTRVCIYVAGSV